MGYCAIQGYAYGNVDKIWRATDSNGNVCGQSDGVASAFPYAYFYNPIVSMNNRYCVDKCPAYVSGAMTAPSCYGGCSGWAQLNEDGTYTGAGVMSGFTNLLYGSNSLIGRICIPNSAVFSNGFQSAVEAFSSATSTGTFSNFITDLKNVKNKFKYRTGNGFWQLFVSQ